LANWNLFNIDPIEEKLCDNPKALLAPSANTPNNISSSKEPLHPGEYYKLYLHPPLAFGRVSIILSVERVSIASRSAFE